ncbi:MAG: lamin tail domain-containing protein, partial [Planctomycetales bacterium]|nr:lamin tail domain-containing protein [Planctomycetales bacterium]
MKLFDLIGQNQYARTLRNNSKHRTGSKNARARISAEALEPRHLLAADPVITEFQAVNVSTLVDEDGDNSDWIEIHNPDTSPIQLDGWYLTDDSSDLAKWRFPQGVQIDAGGYLLVYASGKNRTDAGAALHTNFKLAGRGEFLGIVKPDGETATQSFDPYPEQIEDGSFGLAPGREVTQLIGKGSQASAFIPTDDSLGSDWIATGFSDASWASGNSAVGYETLEPGFEVTDTFDGQLSAEWTIDNPGPGAVFSFEGRLAMSVAESADGIVAESTDRGLAPMVIRDTPKYPATGEPASTWEAITSITQQSTNRGKVGFAILDGTTNLPILKFQYRQRTYFQIDANESRVDRFRESSENEYSLRL